MTMPPQHVKPCLLPPTVSHGRNGTWTWHCSYYRRWPTEDKGKKMKEEEEEEEGSSGWKEQEGWVPPDCLVPGRTKLVSFFSPRMLEFAIYSVLFVAPRIVEEAGGSCRHRLIFNYKQHLNDDKKWSRTHPFLLLLLLRLLLLPFLAPRMNLLGAPPVSRRVISGRFRGCWTYYPLYIAGGVEEWKE